MRKAVYAKDSQSQRPQPVSNRQRSYRASGLALTGCQEMLKWGTSGRPMKVLIPVAVGAIRDVAVAGEQASGL